MKELDGAHEGIRDRLKVLSSEVRKAIRPVVERIEEIVEANQERVLDAFRDAQVSDVHLYGSTGYGYGDRGREVIDEVYANVFGCESALVRAHFVSGTHALATALFGNLRPGDQLIYATGGPYDTLRNTIGIGSHVDGSLLDLGVTYDEVPLRSDESLDTPGLLDRLRPETRVVVWQRSSGYAWRRAMTIDELSGAFEAVHRVRPDIVCMVDNCYGEFVDRVEPSHVGADLVVGSLIKNPGGGLAPTGGYIVGRQAFVERAAARLTAPGIGREAGSSVGTYRAVLQGLFLAPHVVGEALKGAVFASGLFERCGFRTQPGISDPRADIIQAVRFDQPEAMIAFCQAIQAASPIDAHARPEPWAMPGYEHEVIMAAGTFVQGASIELSADGPIRPPYVAYMQGGLTSEHVRIAVLRAIEAMMDAGFIDSSSLQ